MMGTVALTVVMCVRVGVSMPLATVHTMVVVGAFKHGDRGSVCIP